MQLAASLAHSREPHQRTAKVIATYSEGLAVSGTPALRRMMVLSQRC